MKIHKYLLGRPVEKCSKYLVAREDKHCLQHIKYCEYDVWSLLEFQSKNNNK